MSAAAATADDAPKKGKKKLIVIVAVALLVLAIGGGGAVFMMKKKAADAAAAAEAEGDEDAPARPAAKHAAKKEGHGAPTFLPLEPFVVNLADKDADRFAQIGITLEVSDAKAADELKLYMPAIRNGILMVLAHKTSTELLERAGKEALAEEIMRETVRPLGIELPTEGGGKRKGKKAPADVPVLHVHFSSFIIQ